MATTEDPRARSEDDSTAEWKRELYEAKPEREGELFSTISGLENEPLYTPDSVDIDYERDLGYPGVYPFTRGVYPSMYRGKLWTMRQFAGFGGAEETNARFRYLLEHGQTGLSTAFDMPTLMGYDSDHPRSLGEVGREGVAIDSLDDMETLFAGIPLDEVSTSMTINSPAAMLLAFYVCVGEEQGVPRAKLRGTVQTDILKEYIAQKEWIFPPEPSMRLVIDMIEFCAQEMPLWHPISISGYHIREAGSTAAQELAFTLADGFTYVEACIEPFAAVKKLMGQHFDAVVVDCDNEQNATLLFKSARNSSSNQSSLAVAVVEGQAGVAKAFRIGANLVLTKPINVEQAKGTLRVARGLLRKGGDAKAAPPKSASPAPTQPVRPPAPVAKKPVTPVYEPKVSPTAPVARASATPLEVEHDPTPSLDAADLAPGTASAGALLCVAAVIPGKGHDVLLDALATLNGRRWRCLCVGTLERDPTYVATLRRRALDRGMDGRLRFSGALPEEDLARSYRAADLLVLPSRSETYGMVVTEALARGLPVVAAEVGGVPEALGHGADGTRPGLLVPGDDPAALGDALRAWLEDPGLRRRLRRAARERRESLSDWSATTAALADVLERAA
jgi:CheY-like chemotaxis protein